MSTLEYVGLCAFICLSQDLEPKKRTAFGFCLLAAQVVMFASGVK